MVDGRIRALGRPAESQRTIRRRLDGRGIPQAWPARPNARNRDERILLVRHERRRCTSCATGARCSSCCVMPVVQHAAVRLRHLGRGQQHRLRRRRAAIRPRRCAAQVERIAANPIFHFRRVRHSARTRRTAALRAGEVGRGGRVRRRLRPADACRVRGEPDAVRRCS